LIGFAYSVTDPAGRGIALYLREYFGLDKCDFEVEAVECFVNKNFYLVGFSEDVIYFDFLDARTPSSTEYYIVLSRHSSAQGVKSYTVHHTGNMGEALYGGKPGKLSIANPVVSHKILLLLRDKCEEFGREKEYEVRYEATHHGPTDVEKPLSFVEIGSSIDEWRDSVNHRVVGEAIVEFLEKPAHECHVVAGIGGGHYPRKHSELAFTSNYCYGHIMAKHSLQHLSEAILKQMVERSAPKPAEIVVEKKSTRSEHRLLIEEFAKKTGISLKYV